MMRIVDQIRDAFLVMFSDGSEKTAQGQVILEQTGGVTSGGETEEQGRTHGILTTDQALRGTALDVCCPAEKVVAAAHILNDAGFFLEAITGVDWIEDEKIEVIYDYNQYGLAPCRVVVRAFVARLTPELATISTVMPSADWHERETHDFYGVRFIGHPNLRPLLLPDDADFHPLLKDFTP